LIASILLPLHIMKIILENDILSVAPTLKVIKVEASVINPPTSDLLWQELLAEGERIKSTFEMAMINKRPGIAATRQAYKALGKEPNRYRPSSEALCRRLVKGMELYRTLTLIDLINLLSVRSGYSIGGFDLDKIQGDTLRLGAGREGEKFEAIGRGLLNIESLPIYRDEIGGIGTPTSDEERTKLSRNTSRLLMCINIYGEELSIEDTINLTTNLLTRHAFATDINIEIISAQ
jgi:DNA/RNA-binding domain of Phe-tRNA-synthetase-like protein